MGLVPDGGARDPRPSAAPASEVSRATGAADEARLPLAELRRLGARVRPWSARAATGPHGVQCGVPDGVTILRLPSGARLARPAHVSTTFATRLIHFDEAAQ